MYAWGFGGLKPPYHKNFMEIRGRKEGEEEKKREMKRHYYNKYFSRRSKTIN